MATTPGRLLTGLATTLLITSGTAMGSPAVAVDVADPTGVRALPARTGALPAGTRADVILTAPGVTTGQIAAIAARRPTKVTVPSNYVYDPKRGPRHDYCTFAPDEFPAPHAANADFRGPCARHDLCYAGSATKKSCDKALRRNMFRNCEHSYGSYDPLRTACKVVAVTYWAAVVAS